MTGKIMALVDASIYARSVCEHALWAASRTGLAVELLHILGRREASERQDLSGTIALGARSALLEELAALDAQRARLAQARGRDRPDDARAILEAGQRRGVRIVDRLSLPSHTFIRTKTRKEVNRMCEICSNSG